MFTINQYQCKIFVEISIIGTLITILDHIKIIIIMLLLLVELSK